MEDMYSNKDNPSLKTAHSFVSVAAVCGHFYDIQSDSSLHLLTPLWITKKKKILE